MNELLLQLYSKYWNDMMQNVFRADEKNHPSAYPFLLQVTQHYQNAPKRVMFCGMEAEYWGGEFREPYDVTPPTFMEEYHGFVNHNWESNRKQRPGKNSSYWNFQWNIIKRFPKVGYVAQNIVKIGKRWDKGCDDFIFQRTLEHFPVWKEELKILRPDIIIFIAQDSYEGRIRAVAGDFEATPDEELGSFLTKIVFDDPEMPAAYRISMVPRTLQFQGLYNRMADKVSDIIASALDLHTAKKPSRVISRVTIGKEAFAQKVPSEKAKEYNAIGQRLNKRYYAYKQEYPRWSDERVYAAVAYSYAVEKEGLERTNIDQASTLRLRWDAFVERIRIYLLKKQYYKS